MATRTPRSPAPHPLRRPRCLAMLLAVALVPLAHAATPQGQSAEPREARPAAPSLLLVEPEQHPTLTMTWPTADGEQRSLTAELPYTAPAGREAIAPGIEAYVALGGSRLDKGVGDPDGLVVRVGVYRADGAPPIFRDIAPGGVISVELAGVAFNQPVRVDPARLVQHVKFTEQELEACGIGGGATDLFNTSDENDPMRARIRREVARHGFFSTEPDAAPPLARAIVRDATSAVVRVEFPYAALRHPADPSRLEAPGGFQEPSHFHVEFEATPAAVSEDDAERALPYKTDR